MNVSGVIAGPLAGPRVVLIHGLAGSHRTWDRLIPLLQHRFRLLAVDLVGGRRIEDEADGVAALLAERTVAVGHSMGGLVATALAERHPHLVSHLILLNSPPSIESRRSARSLPEQVLRVPMLGEVAWRLARDKQRLRGLQTAVAPGAEVPAPFVADLCGTGRRRLVGSTAAIDNYLSTGQLADRLAALNVPVDIMFGMRDQRVDPAWLKVYAGVPNITVTRLDVSGHTPPWESPDDVAAVITSACDRVALAAKPLHTRGKP